GPRPGRRCIPTPQETLGEVDKALWIFSYYPDHVYGIAGTKAAPPTPTPPTVSEPANGSSSTSSLQNGSATGCQEDPIPNPEPTCLPALSAASSTASNTYPLLEPSRQKLPNGLDVRQPTAHAPSEDVNKENSSVSAQKQSSADSLSLTMHTDTKDPETGSTKFSLVPKSQGLMSGRVARPSTSRAPSRNANIENISGSAQHESSSRSSAMTVHEETKSPKAAMPMFSVVPKSQGFPIGLVVRQSTNRAPSENANQENISGSVRHPSSTIYSSLMVHKETRDAEAGSTKFSSVPKSQGLPSGLAIRPPIARAPSKDANKESISGSAQHHSSANYSSLIVHKETKSTEAGTTKFSSVPKSQGLSSGLLVRPPTARAPCEDVNKENSSVSAQQQFSANYLSVGKHTETKHSEAHRTSFSSVPKGQGLPEWSCRSTTYWPCTLQRCPEPGSTECSSMPTSSASFGQSGVSAERAALREQARKARALRVRGLGGGDPGECPPLMCPVKVLPEHPSSTTYSSLMAHKEPRDAEAGRTKFSSVPKSQGLPRGLAVRPPIARAPSQDANKESIAGSSQHHSSTNYSSLMVHKETKSTEVGATKFSSVRKSQEIPSGLVVRPPTARAPCEDMNKENSSVLAQKQLSADYSSVGKHTEAEDSEADRTWFSLVPKGQGLPSGLVVRPPTGRAPFKNVSKENSSVLAQKQSSANFSSPMVHTETNDPKADRTKIIWCQRAKDFRVYLSLQHPRPVHPS
ncbi:hypothetical protein MRX96_056435, partial [Rhipicephalus microplus]